MSKAGATEAGHVEKTVRVPLAEMAGYAVRHVDVRLTTSQAHTLRRLTLALDQRASRLRPHPQRPGDAGRVVQSPADALRWVLEQLDE